MTTLRQELLGILQKKHVLSVREILQNLKKLQHEVNKTTVYRALDYLEKEGYVCRHSFSERESVYEIREDHHDHLLCTSCGKITSTDCAMRLPKKVEGFMVDHHHLTLYGVCKVCTGSKA